TRRAARKLAREIADETPGERFAQRRRKRRCSIKDSAVEDGMVEVHALLDPIAGAQLKHRLFSVAKALGDDPENKATFAQRSADAVGNAESPGDLRREAVASGLLAVHGPCVIPGCDQDIIIIRNPDGTYSITTRDGRPYEPP
ncbi:MAG: DUF222 domain-containing protein, partial [Acidimicrobiales bacterium]